MGEPNRREKEMGKIERYLLLLMVRRAVLKSIAYHPPTTPTTSTPASSPNSSNICSFDLFYFCSLVFPYSLLTGFNCFYSYKYNTNESICILTYLYSQKTRKKDTFLGVLDDSLKYFYAIKT